MVVTEDRALPEENLHPEGAVRENPHIKDMIDMKGAPLSFMRGRVLLEFLRAVLECQTETEVHPTDVRLLPIMGRPLGK